MYDIEHSSYQEIKADIKDDLNKLAERFVIIGYRLKRIRDEKLYEIDGYKTITEFAQAEYGMSQSETSRFIAINDKYSINGSSPKLLPQYEGYGKSKLSEMLNMSENELKLVTIQTTRAEIREIKEAKREAESEIYAPAHNPESHENTQSETNFEGTKMYIIPDAEKLIIEFFREKQGREILKELSGIYSGADDSREWELKAAEVINPTGHYFFRYKMTILIFEEELIKYNKFGGTNTEYRYSDFLHDMLQVFDFGSRDPWVAYYGEPEPDPEPVKAKESEKVPEKKDTKDRPAPKQEPKKPEKPNATQSKQSKTEEEEIEDEDEGEETEGQEQDEELPGQMGIDDYPDVAPESSDKVTENVSDDSKVTETVINNETTLIDELELSVHTYNILKRAGINTIAELCELTEDEVIRLRNISRKSLDEILSNLKNAGLKLKGPEEDILKCRICGCTDDHACPGGCYWVEPDLCSKCAENMGKQTDEKVEIVDADIIHKPKQEVVLLENEDGSKELQILISGSQGIKLIRVIDADTGESWEVSLEK